MHVLQVAWEYPPRLFGGLGRSVEGVTVALAAGGTAVTVLTPHHAGPETAPPGVAVLRARPPAATLPADRWLAEVLDAGVAMAERALLAGVRPDVIHVHDWMAGHAARILAAALDVGVVATIHATERGRHMGHLPPGYSTWIDAQERALVGLADRVVVCSRAMADHVTATLDVPPGRVDVIANGVDVAAWRAPAGDGPARRRAEDRPRVVCAGRLEHEKGIHVLLDALDAVSAPAARAARPTSGRTAPPAWDVVIAGQGTHDQALRKRAHPAVTFAGHLAQPELARLLRSADVVVVPSLYEPFGLAALEAMAAGVPVVASDVGGLAEVVVPGAGVLVPPGDPDALALAVRRVLADGDLAATLVAEGTARAGSLSWGSAATAHLPIYAAVRRGPIP